MIDLAACARRALARMDLGARTAAALPSPRAATLIAIGKAAPAMAKAAFAAWPIREAVIVTTDATPVPRSMEGFVLRANHPLPDRRSVRAAERCLALAAEADELLVLVSGGASALVCAPAGIDLRTKRAVVKALLLGGASIQEMNVVRKHLSRVKGGALARACPGRVLTLVASDVVGGTASDVASGPSVSDPSTVREARRILARRAPAFRDLPLVRTGFAPGRSRIIASPEDFARAMVAELAGHGVRARLLPPSQADVVELAASYRAAAHRLAPGEAIVRAAEPSVTVTKKGKGGRSTHLATLVGRDLPAGYRFLALASDGVDGASETAGALVRTLPRAAADASLARFATGPFLAGLGVALAARPTGHNLADLHVLLRERPAREGDPDEVG